MVEASYGDVSRLREGKYSWLVGASENDVVDNLDAIKDICFIKIVRQTFSIVDAVLNVVSEKAK